MKKLLFLCSLFALVSGCFIQSIHPFYTEETKVKLDTINGEWLSVVQSGKNVENKKISPWSFKDETLITYDEKNIKSKLECTYFKAGNNLFIDTIAGEPDTEANAFWVAGIALVHTVCKVTLNKNTLELTPINFDWFEKRIKEKKLDLSYEEVKDGNYIFTVTPEAWIKFLKKYGDDSEVFNKKNNFSFHRKIKHPHQD